MKAQTPWYDIPLERENYQLLANFPGLVQALQ
jgi:hypothetical protein